MKYTRFILIGLVVLVMVYGVGMIFKNRTQNQEQPNQQWETKTDQQSSVTVKVTPLELGANVKNWKFKIILDTHSGSLDADLLKSTVLIDAIQQAHYPTAWEGSEPGGHHREGILVFDNPNLTPLGIELKIKNIGGVPERSFKW